MEHLLFYPLWAQIILVLLIFCVPSVLGLYLVRRLVPLDRLKENHEVAGFTFGVLGAFYGLLLAFVIVAAWERFDLASQEVQKEAVSLAELYRLTTELHDPARAQIHQQIRLYISDLENYDWPAMAQSRYEFSHARANSLPLWHLISSYRATNERESLVLDKSLDQLDQITDSGADRDLFYAESLPTMVWLIIYLGGIIVIAFSYFFGLKAFRSQALMVAIFAGLLGLTILAVLELAHPYRGRQTVSIIPMRHAQLQIDAIDAQDARSRPSAQSQAPPPLSSPSG
jgi:hypothetical protein